MMPPRRSKLPMLLLVALLILQGPMVPLAAIERPETAPVESKELVDLDLKDADITDVMRYFSFVAGVNVVLDPAVSGKVTVRLIDVPWDIAMELILKSHGYWYDLDGNILSVAPISKLTQRAQEEADLREQRRLSAPLVTTTVRISYAKAADVARIVEQVALSPRGSIVVDPRTNSLIITDIEAELPRARRVVRGLDR